VPRIARSTAQPPEASGDQRSEPATHTRLVS
jgi:hypothetical protein